MLKKRKKLTSRKEKSNLVLENTNLKMKVKLEKLKSRRLVVENEGEQFIDIYDNDEIQTTEDYYTVDDMDIFEELDWSIRYREDIIDELINWISEADGNNRVMMKDDLKYLINLNDEFIWDNMSTNAYVAESDNPEEYKRIGNELLALIKR